MAPHCPPGSLPTTPEPQSPFAFLTVTHTITVAQPKDTVINKLELDPATGQLTLEGYSATANAAAITATEAQIQAKAQTAKPVIEAFVTSFPALNALAASSSKTQSHLPERSLLGPLENLEIGLASHVPGTSRDGASSGGEVKSPTLRRQ